MGLCLPVLQHESPKSPHEQRGWRNGRPKAWCWVERVVDKKNVWRFKGDGEKKQHNQLFKDHVTWFMWTPQVAILSKHVLMFVISKFYAWISVMWFVVRVEPKNHLGLIQVDTRNSFKIYYCIWAAHLNLWTEKSTLPSNGSVNWPSCSREKVLLWFGGNLIFHSTIRNSWMKKITLVHDIWPNALPVL